MLLPSDVARLVLGYLQQEKLASTCSAFIAESPNLKEYAEHYTDEGFVPGCLLSLFGKNLTAILNEYVTMKAKEMTNDVPLMISSLWKKLEFTLSQIRSMQNSAAFSANQRARTRSAIADMRRQKTLDFPSTSSSLSNQSGPLISRPLAARPVRLQCALRPTSIPLSISSSEATEKQPTTSIGDRSTVVPSHKGRKHSNMMSPGRRKIESQKRRPCSSARNLDHSNTAPIEEQSDPLQELIDGNFPKLVIESARDRFLSNKSLQEKLAENINKFLGSDANVAPAARPADSSAADADTAIDEILGLEGGEIHMSDEAIHDILQQTESDPAFQALFDLFDFGKTKEGKKTSTDTMSQNEDCLNPNTLEESYSDTLQNSFTIENVGEGNTQNATRDSSNQDEVNSMIVDNTFPETLDRSGNEIVDNHVEMAASNQDSGKLFSSVCKTQVNSADSEENNAQTTVCLHSEREVDKSSTELLPVQNHKQIGKIQESPLFEHDIPKSVPLQSRADEVGSQSAVSNSSPVSPVETATMMGNEKRKSISNEPSLHGLELNKTNISEHSGVMSDVEMKDISSSKDKRTDLECVPDILNIAPLSEDVQATPFVAEPVKLFNESGHEGSTTVNPSTDSSKDQTDGSETTPTSSQIVKPSSAHQMDTQISQVCSVDIPSQTEASCPPVSEEKQNQVAVSVPIDTSEPPVVDVVPHTSHSEEPAPLAAILKESLPSADVCTDKETISHATSSIEEEHMVGSTQRSTVTSASSTCIGLAPENTFTIIDSSTVPSCAGNVPSSSSSQLSDVVDPSKIMSLKIIISEDSHLGDAELNNAVSSITGENLPTIVLSSPGKIQVQNVSLSQSVSAEESVTSLEGIADVVFVDQCLPVHTFTDQASGTISFKADDGTVFSVAGAPSLSSDGGFLQLMPATSTAFGQSNSIYLTTCMSDNASFRNTKSQSKITPIAAKRQSQVHTPPRPRNVITVGQALSPKVSQGSTIIFASPVQPGMLQMGMIPLSVVGPNRNTYSTFPGQILQMPATSPLSSRGIPKLPIAPKNPKTIGSKSTIHTGRILKRKDEVSSHPVPIQPHRSEPSEAVVTSDGQKKAEEPFIVPSSAPSSSTKATGSHRRMLSFEDKGSSDPDGGASQVPNTRNKSQGKERPDSLLHSLQAAVGASQYIKIMQSNDNNKTDNNNSLSVSSVSQTDITATKMLVSSSTKDADPGQKVTISDSISDKTSANKENTLTRGSEQQHKQDAQKPSTNQEHVAFNYEKTVPLVKEMSRKGILPNILRKSPLDPRKEVGKSHLISPLSKQAAEMLQGIQMRSPTPKQTGDLPLPRTPGSEMNMLDGVRTPTSKTTFEEGGTPRALLLPATPEMQGCSPASEAGSENSVSMAAHTLMILSRASIANTGNTPLKDNTQHVKSRSTVKKRKLEETEECERQTRLSKKELQSPQTPLKKKKKKPKNKRSLDSFPAGMDVDKFLLSLHYDE